MTEKEKKKKKTSSRNLHVYGAHWLIAGMQLWYADVGRDQGSYSEHCKALATEANISKITQRTVKQNEQT